MIDKVTVVLLIALAVNNALYVPLGFELVGKKYMVSTIEAPFFEAYVTCRSHGFNIAHVSNAEENSLLNSSVAQYIRFWIGGVNYDAIFDRNWFWIDSGASVNFTYWGSSEPSLQSGINGLGFKSGFWYAYNVSNSFQFICEI